MESYSFLLFLAIILLFTKLFGLATERIHLPQVVGALVAGIILGPSGFGAMEASDFLHKTAEIGVILLMFTAGIDTEWEDLKETGFQAFVIALLGVVVPLLVYGWVYYVFYEDHFTMLGLMKGATMGTVFVATSVGITVETLNEMGKLRTKTGTTLVSAAIIDDILGIVLLSIVTGISSGSSEGGGVGLVLLKIFLFIIFLLIVGFVVKKVFAYVERDHWHSKRIAVWAFAFCLILSYCAETFFGVADITGAYFAGLILCNMTRARQFIAKKMAVTSYMVFTPVFFASVGLGVNLRNMNANVLLFAIVLVVLTVVTKVVGCGLGAKACGMSTHSALVVGIGMVSRSEVALMVAQKGVSTGMIDPILMPAVIMAVIASALLTPILLKPAIDKGPEMV